MIDLEVIANFYEHLTRYHKLMASIVSQTVVFWGIETCQSIGLESGGITITSNYRKQV